MPDCLTPDKLDLELLQDKEGSALTPENSAMFSIVDKKLRVELGTRTNKAEPGVVELVLKIKSPASEALVDLHVEIVDARAWFI